MLANTRCETASWAECPVMTRPTQRPMSQCDLTSSRYYYRFPGLNVPRLRCCIPRVLYVCSVKNVKKLEGTLEQLRKRQDGLPEYYIRKRGAKTQGGVLVRRVRRKLSGLAFSLCQSVRTCIGSSRRLSCTVDHPGCLSLASLLNRAASNLFIGREILFA